MVGYILHFRFVLCNRLFLVSGTEHSNRGTVAKGELIQRVTFSGTVSPNRKSVITAPYNGYVRNVYVRVGEKVQE